jgi:hypothetical protein
MKLTDIINEIGDASAKPFKWSANRTIDLVSKQFIIGIDKRTPSRDWIGPIKFGYTAHSNKAQYDITMEAMGRKRMVLQLPGKPKRKYEGPQYEMEVWISFTVDSSDEDTNINEQYSVMATLIECVEDFIKKASKYFIIKQINILPKSDTGPDAQFDSQRGRLYLAYVKRNIDKLPGKWTAFSDEDGISIRNGSWEGENIVAKSQNT